MMSPTTSMDSMDLQRSFKSADIWARLSPSETPLLSNWNRLPSASSATFLKVTMSFQGIVLSSTSRVSRHLWKSKLGEVGIRGLETWESPEHRDFSYSKTTGFNHRWLKFGGFILGANHLNILSRNMIHLIFGLPWHKPSSYWAPMSGSPVNGHLIHFRGGLPVVGGWPENGKRHRKKWAPRCRTIMGYIMGCKKLVCWLCCCLFSMFMIWYEYT